jgi:hypothetical protein
MHERNHELLEALDKCAAECSHCAVACLDEKDVTMLARCIKLDIIPAAHQTLNVQNNLAELLRMINGYGLT